MRKIEILFSEVIADQTTSKEEIQEVEILVDDQKKWERKAYDRGLKKGLTIGVFGMVAVAIAVRTK